MIEEIEGPGIEEEVEGAVIYQIPPQLASNPESLEQMGKPIPGGWYFAPESSWDYTKSPFSNGYETRDLAVSYAKSWVSRSK